MSNQTNGYEISYLCVEGIRVVERNFSEKEALLRFMLYKNRKTSGLRMTGPNLSNGNRIEILRQYSGSFRPNLIMTDGRDVNGIRKR